MSAWGTGTFQNDDAGDWILALADGSSDEVAMALESCVARRTFDATLV